MLLKPMLPRWLVVLACEEEDPQRELDEPAEVNDRIWSAIQLSFTGQRSRLNTGIDAGHAFSSEPYGCYSGIMYQSGSAFAL